MLVLQGTRESVHALEFSPDGGTLVASSPSGVQVWSGLAGKRPSAVLPHIHVSHVRFSPDGRKVLLDGYPHEAVLRDWPTGKVAVLPDQFPHGGGACDLSPDGRFVVVCRIHSERKPPSQVFCCPVDDPAALAWSVASRRWLYSRPLFLPGEDRFVVLECRPGSWLAAEGLVYVTRDARTGKVVAEVPARGDYATGAVQSADRRLIAARQRSCLAVLRADDLGTEPITIHNETPRDFTALAFHPSGRFLAATSNDGAVKLYDTSTWALARAFDWDIGRLRSVAFSPDGMLAAAGGDKGKIVVWDVDL